MSEKEVFDKLINIFNIVINRSVDVSKINIDSKIVEDLGVNSIGLIYLAVAVEEEFDVDMSKASSESFKTIKDVINYING